MSEKKLQPPFNPLEEFCKDSSGIEKRANERRRRWEEYNKECLENEECPLGECKPNFKCTGESITVSRSSKCTLEAKIDWDNVRERMNDWSRKTQNSEFLNVFFNWSESVCEELKREDNPPIPDQREDNPPIPDQRKVKYNNLGEGWHAFSCPVDDENHLGLINALLLDNSWEFIMDKEENIRLQALILGRSTKFTSGILNNVDGDAHIKFKIL